MPPENPRQIYLLQTLKLSHDPFANPVAEQEIRQDIPSQQEKNTEAAGERTKESYFFNYYVDPQNSSSDLPIPQALRQARNGLIYGEPGSGKTTLRYTLEAECRTVPDRTLVVTYELSDFVVQSLTADEHWRNLAQELAVDLFIQVIEQLDTFDTPTTTQKQHFQKQMALAWPRLHRVAAQILNEDLPDTENGLARLWGSLRRPAIRYVHPSSKIYNLLHECLPVQTKTVHPQEVTRAAASAYSSGLASLEGGLAAAKAWGFKRIFTLIDGVDAHEREVESMMALVTPLLDHLAHWQAENLFFYFFLTADMQDRLQELYAGRLRNLPYPPLYHLLEWDERRLEALLQQRFRAAHSRTPGFNALGASDLADKLGEYLIQAAQKSPRRLLRLVSSLIDAHARTASDQPLFTIKDWRDMRKYWSYGSPFPPELPGQSFNSAGVQ